MILVENIGVKRIVYRDVAVRHQRDESKVLSLIKYRQTSTNESEEEQQGCKYSYLNNNAIQVLFSYFKL